MSLSPPIKVGKLQTALHTKAKNSPDYRFYALYDKIYRWDVLGFAYARCRDNGGAPGIDGQSFAAIEEYGALRWLDELTEELRNETYHPEPVRRVYIPKPDGKQRPLESLFVRSLRRAHLFDELCCSANGLSYSMIVELNCCSQHSMAFLADVPAVAVRHLYNQSSYV